MPDITPTPIQGGPVADAVATIQTVDTPKQNAATAVVPLNPVQDGNSLVVLTRVSATDSATVTDAAGNAYAPIFSQLEQQTNTLVQAATCPASAGSPDRLTIVTRDGGDVLAAVTVEASGVTEKLQAVATQFQAARVASVLAKSAPKP